MKRLVNPKNVVRKSVGNAYYKRGMLTLSCI